MNDSQSLPSVFSAGNVAVVTGAASGIGLAAARRFASLGMKLVMVDLAGAALDAAAEEVARLASSDVIAAATDVADPEQLGRLQAEVIANFGPVSLLMNNAGVGNNPGLPWEHAASWKKLVDVNLWGVVNGVQAFLPGMLATNEPGMVINTGSKQGITSPPGNPAYNMSKAALKNYTESLSHALREACGTRISAHLLIPGYTYTGMTSAAEKPASAWSPEQVVEFMLEAVAAGDFYVLCPDNAVDRGTDEKRMRWAADDIIQNRPALSRWHPDYEAAFAKFMADDARK
ncbi:MAG TPA: SDR family NAD(P)-dependent oxidoreductase [Polyangiaceae bacterium]|jgi:NAD(P)-dependent dehydrogenase (short-subunit alcohol dehydrogenase family)